jgi:CheY-like chemotaxis protein
MDGLEASAKINELKPGIPIVALTANIMPNDREIYKISGMNDCVGKPFTSQELWRCLMKHFKPVSWKPMGDCNYAQAEIEMRRRLISDFMKNNQTMFTQITEAINAGDINLAFRLVHTLKSSASQLGKMLLHQAAMDVEHRLKDGKNLVLPEHLTMLKTELNAVLSQFSTELGSLLDVLKKPAAVQTGQTVETLAELKKKTEFI